MPRAASLTAWGIILGALQPFPDASGAPACKVGLWREDGRPLLETAALLAARWPSELTVQGLDGGAFLNLSAAGANKAVMVEALLAASGLTPAAAIAFGDHRSDVEMLAAAGYAVAIAGGHADALAVADEIAPSPDAEGIAAVLDRVRRDGLRI